MYKATDTINMKGLEASYMVSYRVARTVKPHTIVQEVITPAAADMAGTMLGGKGPKSYTVNVFIKQQFHDTSVTWHEMFLNNDCFASKPVNYMLYSRMSQQTWRAWHSSWYMSVTFMGGQLRKTSSSAKHWKPGQQEMEFVKY